MPDLHKVKEGETVLAYVTRLKKLSASCEFPIAEDRIRDYVIEKVSSNRLRQVLGAGWCAYPPATTGNCSHRGGYGQEDEGLRTVRNYVCVSILERCRDCA